MPPEKEYRAQILQHCIIQNQAPLEDSIVHIAAMHAGASLYDMVNHRLSDFSTTPKKPFFIYSEILCPNSAPAWVKDRSILWNELEKTASTKTAQLALEVKLTLPLNIENYRYINSVKQFIHDELITQDLYIDASAHISKPHDPHAHLLIPLFYYKSNSFHLESPINIPSLLAHIEKQWQSYLKKV